MLGHLFDKTFYLFSFSIMVALGQCADRLLALEAEEEVVRVDAKQ